MKNTIKTITGAILLLTVTLSSCAAPRRAIKVLDVEGEKAKWTQVSVSASMARRIESKYRRSSKSTSLIRLHKQWWGDGSVYLLVHYPMPIAEKGLVRINRTNIRYFCLPEGLVKIERMNSAPTPELIEI